MPKLDLVEIKTDYSEVIWICIIFRLGDTDMDPVYLRLYNPD